MLIAPAFLARVRPSLRSPLDAHNLRCLSTNWGVVLAQQAPHRGRARGARPRRQ